MYVRVLHGEFDLSSSITSNDLIPVFAYQIRPKQLAASASSREPMKTDAADATATRLRYEWQEVDVAID